MKKKLLILGLGVCLFAAACGKKDTPKDELPKQSAEEQAEEDNNSEQEEETDQQTEKEEEQQKPEEDASEPEVNEETNGVSGQELSKVPEVTFVDYSQNIKDEESNVLMLSVAENCPVITIEENENIAERMNLVFEQQHEANQEEINRRVDTAKEYYRELPGDEAASWTGHGYGMSYKLMYASTRLLSLEAECYEWEGTPHPNTWTSAYCFDVTSGDLLSLVDVFTDERGAREVVSQHIIATVTEDPYKDALLDDYESYVNDVMTENTFYLNDKGLVVICNPYMITAYAAGKIEVEIPYEELGGMINERFLQ